MPERLVFFGTSDLAGLVRGKSFPESDLESRLRRGVGITHSNLMLSAFGPILATPFGTTGDLQLRVSPATRAIIPMQDGSEGLLYLGDFHTLEGAHWSHCPRGLLQRAAASLKQISGLELRCAFEQEFVYSGVAEVAGAPYSLGAFRRQGGFGAALMGAIRACDIEPDSFLAEYGPRQYEVTIGPTPALQAADQAVVVRELIRAVAAQAGHSACLAPMITPEGVGSGTHIHFSLWNAHGQPVTLSPDGIHGLGPQAEAFVAGVLRELPALAAVTAPSPPSYLRLKPGRWAPSHGDLGVLDRGSALRICPVIKGTPESEARQFNVEYRVADATASPYLALGCVIAAGAEGIRAGLRLADAPPAPLPQTLTEALDHFEASAAAKGWFGAEFHDAYLMFKRAEVAAVASLSPQALCDRYAEIY